MPNLDDMTDRQKLLPRSADLMLTVASRWCVDDPIESTPRLFCSLDSDLHNSCVVDAVHT